MRDLLIRIRIILLSILFILLITGFLVFPQAIADIADEIQDQEDNVRILLALIAVLVDAILLFVIVQEIRSRSRLHDGLVVRSRAADVEISLESVTSNLDTQIAKLDDIFAVQTSVTAERGRVNVEVDIDAEENINVRNKTNEVRREIVKIVEKQMGLKFGRKPILKFRLMSEPAAIAPPVEASDTEKKKGRLTNFFSREKAVPETPEPVSEPEPEKTDTESVIPLPPPPVHRLETEAPIAVMSSVESEAPDEAKPSPKEDEEDEDTIPEQAENPPAENDVDEL